MDSLTPRSIARSTLSRLAGLLALEAVLGLAYLAAVEPSGLRLDYLGGALRYSLLLAVMCVLPVLGFAALTAYVASTNLRPFVRVAVLVLAAVLLGAVAFVQSYRSSDLAWYEPLLLFAVPCAVVAAYAFSRRRPLLGTMVLSLAALLAGSVAASSIVVSLYWAG